ncbi:MULTISPECIES: SDR family NAD(P)-dependent oxidoreductase [unclassified Dietzia]|uniref:SDR family NAD(P)-dependent oxidoreductase n=1 Tax=unclassified Dietzia TaxID=2617939 RepID=UPI000D221697|nr:MULTISPECIES: SDR family NAD(P)-dependent oxidoreductase [unclassified Dietzia]AVZ39811.1 oxidoreductase [Dietzia sp. JS16-p6b]MBB1023708.1 SDR family oxidoreductase [Dietzia sp. DQ12-76]MBB1028589.1 SDR family oxidoreductase [Dietzia sp. DQ11-38-2]QGW25170.1 ketoreductase/dehydrogenase [Dietzia sp. DQ12-45-1b]
MTAPQNTRFEGRVALVTGAASGIGAAVARQLAAEGARRIHLVDLARESAQRVASEIGGVAHGVDVADPDAVRALFEEISAEDGRVDVVVHAAGIDDPVAKAHIYEAAETGEPVDVLSRLDDSTWRRIHAVNLDGTFHVLRESVRAMRPGGGGAIVTVGSSAAFDTLVGYPHYASSKAAVHALSQSVAKEAVHFGIRVNTVAPGPVDTAMAARTPESVRARMNEGSAFGYATAEQLSESICYLASDQASNVVGAVLLSNGGRFTV